VATKEKYFEKTLVKAFKHKDFEDFKNLIATPEDLAGGLSANSLGLPHQLDNKDLVEEYRRTYISDAKNLFDQLIKQGEMLGVTWSDIEFENFLYNINDSIAGLGVQLMNGHINIKMQDKSYFFYGIDAQEYKTGYKISFIRDIKRGHLKEYVNSNDTPETNL
jgi:hypothetical protein